MRELPILFSARMVNAILAGTKTQTRRIVTAPKCVTLYGRSPRWDSAFVDPGPSPAGNPGPYLKLPYSGGDLGEDELVERVYPRWFVGDRLWVREAWKPETFLHDGLALASVAYRADGATRELAPPDSWHFPKAAIAGWVPGIHMPRWASRLTLEVTFIRVERLRSITEQDAVAEGIGSPEVNPFYNREQDAKGSNVVGWSDGDARYLFRALWDSINGKRPGCSWESSPWVWVVSFKRVDVKSEAAE